ncbi:uncharacterized protein TNCV_4444821 [Trichonephila clavipes]|nr:uncharacterized protein TNCV_4444821 [Trichonephila clavipes]
MVSNVIYSITSNAPTCVLNPLQTFSCGFKNFPSVRRRRKSSSALAYQRKSPSTEAACTQTRFSKWFEQGTNSALGLISFIHCCTPVWHPANVAALSKACPLQLIIVAAVAEWYRHRIVAGFVTSSSPVPLQTRRVGQRCTLNLSRAETSSRWCGVVVRRGGASSGVVHVT